MTTPDLATFLAVRGLSAGPHVLRAICDTASALNMTPLDLAEGLADAAIGEHERLGAVLGRSASVLLGALAQDVPSSHSSVSSV